MSARVRPTRSASHPKAMEHPQPTMNSENSNPPQRPISATEFAYPERGSSSRSAGTSTCAYKLASMESSTHPPHAARKACRWCGRRSASMERSLYREKQYNREMPRNTRREFLGLAASFGASLGWARGAAPSRVAWTERRDMFPQGVASGDPRPDSVIVWTRRPPSANSIATRLTMELAEDSAFRRIVSTVEVPVSAEADWTCRVLVAR